MNIFTKNSLLGFGSVMSLFPNGNIHRIEPPSQSDAQKLAGDWNRVGGRSAASENVLLEIKEDCLDGLRKNAYEIGADAVIAVNLDFNEFSGKGKSMLFVVSSGTAIKYTSKNEETELI